MPILSNTEIPEKISQVSIIMGVSGVNSLRKLPVMVAETGSHNMARNNEKREGYLNFDEGLMYESTNKLTAIKANQLIRLPSGREGINGVCSTNIELPLTNKKPAKNI